VTKRGSRPQRRGGLSAVRLNFAGWGLWFAHVIRHAIYVDLSLRSSDPLARLSPRNLQNAVIAKEISFASIVN
jgi:hypothetical protein